MVDVKRLCVTHLRYQFLMKCMEINVSRFMFSTLYPMYFFFRKVNKIVRKLEKRYAMLSFPKFLLKVQRKGMA